MSFRDQQIHRVAPEFNLSQQQQVELSPDFQSSLQSSGGNSSGNHSKPKLSNQSTYKVSSFQDSLQRSAGAAESHEPPSKLGFDFKTAFDLANSEQEA